MQEQLISFETAVLAKKKGFHYMKANIYGDNMTYHLDDGQLLAANLANTTIGYVLAPTLPLLQKWIREEHNLSIHVDDFTTDSKIRYDYSVGKLGSQDDNPHGIFETYDEALEEGLQSALNLIEDE